MTETVIKGKNEYIVHSDEQLSLFLSNGWELKPSHTPEAEAPVEKKRRIKKESKQ